MKKIKSIVFTLFTMTTIGCATINSPKQLMYIKTNGKYDMVQTRDGQAFNVPGIVEFDRKSDQYLKILGADQKIPLTTNYRWKESFLYNFAFLTLAPVGWITDLISGAAWETKPIGPLKLEENGIYEPQSETKPSLAVAPTTYLDGNISDEISKILEKNLRAKFEPKFQVLEFKETLPKFESFGLDYNEEITKENALRVFKELQVRKIFDSKTEFVNDSYVIKGEIHSLGEEKTETLEFIVPAKDITNFKSELIGPQKTKYFYLFPNAFSIDLASKSSSISVNNRDLDFVTSEPNNFKGQMTKLFSAVGFRHVFTPLNRPGWRYRGAFVPSFNFSYLNLKIDNEPLFEGQKFELTNASAGYGISFNYETSNQNIYFNIIPLLTYTTIKGTSDVATSEQMQTTTNTEIEMGYTYFFNNNFRLNFFTRSLDVPEKAWKKTLSDTTGQEVLVDNSSIQVGGISFIFMLDSFAK